VGEIPQLGEPLVPRSMHCLWCTITVQSLGYFWIGTFLKVGIHSEFFATAELHEKTCSKFSSMLHIGHLGLELKYLCILVPVLHSFLMNFNTGTSLARLRQFIDSDSSSHAIVASFALAIPMCFSKSFYSFHCVSLGRQFLESAHISYCCFPREKKPT